MPASSRNVNVQHGPIAHRGRLRHQTPRSSFPEERPETERRSSRSEETKTTNRTSAGNRFAALAHTEPAPGVDLERGIQPVQTDFTFRYKRPSRTATGNTVASEDQQPSNAQGNGKVLALQPVVNASTSKQSDPVLTPALLAELRVTALLQVSENPRAPATPPHTPPSEARPFFAQSSVHNSPPAVSTGSLSPKSIDVPATSRLRALEPHIGALQTLLPSSSPLMTDLPVRPPRKLILPKPKVHLPPTRDTTPSPETAAPCTLFPASDPLVHTVTSAEGRILAMADETAAATSGETLEAISNAAERLGSKRAPISGAHSSKRSKESSVDEMSEDGSDGEWELI